MTKPQDNNLVVNYSIVDQVRVGLSEDTADVWAGRYSPGVRMFLQ
jgi:hypothetical protein